MAARLSSQIREQVESASQLYHRLVIVVGPPRSGKTTALRELHDAHGWPLVNVNLDLSRRLLEVASKQRSLRAARLVDDILLEQPGETVLLDNIEMLFHPDLKQDPLRLLQSLSRNRTLVVTWRGRQLGSSLTYAAPDHPEFRRIEEPQALIVSCGTAETQEHST